MFVLITGQLWRDPATRVSKTGAQYVTALLRAGTATEAQWANIVCFDAAAQSELLRLRVGDSVCVQGPAKLGVFQDKAGEHRVSLSVTANHVLALRQPAKPKQAEGRQAPPLMPAFDDAVPF
jgi:single-stranded DNA-binding protein